MTRFKSGVAAMIASMLLTSRARGEDSPFHPDERQVLERLELLGGQIDTLEDGRAWKLSLRGKAADDGALQSLGTLPELSIIDLTGTRMSDALLSSLHGLNHLRILELDGTDVTDAGLTQLAPLKALEHLSLSSTTVSDAGLLELAKLPQLESLHLDGTRVTDAGCEHLRVLSKLRMLTVNRRIVPSFSISAAEDASGAARFEATPNVREDPSVETRITDLGVERLAKMNQLEWLELDGADVTDAGLAPLASLTGLKHLSLENTPIGDAALPHLADLTALEWLGLANTRVSDLGLTHLERLTRLEVLVLSNTKVSNAGLSHLSVLTGLRSLFLDHTQVNDAGIRQLRKSLPHLHTVEFPRPARDRAGEQARNEIIGLVDKGDLQTFADVVKRDPAAVNYRWSGNGKGDLSGRLHGMRPLHIAAQRADLPFVQFLLDQQAAIDGAGQNGGTPLHFAASSGIAALLLERGARVDAQNALGRTPLFDVENVEVARLLLDHAAAVNHRDKLKGTPLGVAAKDGRLEIARLLIARGADVNGSEGRKSTPLYWAAWGGHFELASLLIEHGADVNAGRWPAALGAAIEEGHAPLVELLITHGAEVKQTTPGGWTLLHTAIAWHSGGEIIRMLLDAGLSPHAQVRADGPRPNRFFHSRYFDTRGWSIIHFASEQGDFDAVRLLIERGADVAVRSPGGHTALTLAEEMEEFHPDVIQGTTAANREFNRRRAEEVNQRNANRRLIAQLIRELLTDAQSR